MLDTATKVLSVVARSVRVVALTNDDNVAKSFNSLIKAIAEFYTGYLGGFSKDKLTVEILEIRHIVRDAAALFPVLTREDLAQAISFYFSKIHKPIRDRTTGKEVEVILDVGDDVYMAEVDLGGLFRSLSNIVRDAAGHAQIDPQTGKTYALVKLQKEGSNICLNVLTLGSLDEEGLALIGRQVYSTADGKARGRGKISVTQTFKEILKKLGLEEARIEEILAKQWSNTRAVFTKETGSLPAVKWRMVLPSRP